MDSIFFYVATVLNDYSWSLTHFSWAFQKNKTKIKAKIFYVILICLQLKMAHYLNKHMDKFLQLFSL